jgi:hypothetical protein
MLLRLKGVSASLFFCVAGIVFAVHGQGIPPAPALAPIAGKKVSPQNAPTASAATAAAAENLFSIGDPTDDEQMYLELINRARANPPAEANRIIGLNDIFVQNALALVDTNVLLAQFSSIPATAPLSFSANLSVAARSQAQYQFDNGIQSHIGPGTNTLRERLQMANYVFSWASENVYSYAENAQHGHAGFEIDWSGDTANGGLQSPPGHRNNMNDQRFTEVGIGVINGTNQVGNNAAVGPQLVTQDFGTPYPAVTYITGVAFYDLNGNNFYDLGEGLGGVDVTIDGVASYAVTASSGGYSIPVEPDANYTVHFKPAGAAEIVTSVNVPGTNNVKLDFKPVFNPSTVTSAPANTYAGISNVYSFSSLAGATGYRARIFNLQTAPFEGAEGPLTNVALTTYGGYAAISSTVKASGSNSFHLRHITDAINTNAYPQYLQFVKPFFVEAGAKIDFKSRLGIAYAGTAQTGPGETARLEISLDEGNTWTSIWSQAGVTQDHGADNSEKTFNARSVSLTNYVGKLVMLRFNFDVDPEVGWFDEAGDAYGWYVDDVTITATEQGMAPSTASIDASAKIQFIPPAAGRYILQFGAIAGSRNFPMGPWTLVTAQPAPPIVSFNNNVSIARGVVSMTASGVSGTIKSITVESSASPGGPWSTETGATVSGPNNGAYTIRIPTNGDTRFYRAFAN